MIKAILFDFGQTLVDAADGFRAAEKEAQSKLFANMGNALYANFMSDYRRIRKILHERSNFSRTYLWGEVYHCYSRNVDDQLLEKWEIEYWETVTSKTHLFPETQNVLNRLASEYRLGLITNTQGQRRFGNHRLNQFPELERYFEFIVVAGEDGIPPKPAPEPFCLGLNELAINPSEAVYIGDDYRIDICGAKAVGMHAIWIQHHSVQRSWPQVETSAPIITCLDQLLDLKRILKLP